LDAPRKKLRRWRKIPPHFLGTFLASFGSAIWGAPEKMCGAGARIHCIFWGPFWHPQDRPFGRTQKKSEALAQDSSAFSGHLFGILWTALWPVWPSGGAQQKPTALVQDSTAFSGVLFGILRIGQLDGPGKNLRRSRKIPPHVLGTFLASFGSALWRGPGKIYGAGARIHCMFWGPFRHP